MVWKGGKGSEGDLGLTASDKPPVPFESLVPGMRRLKESLDSFCTFPDLGVAASGRLALESLVPGMRLQRR